MYGGKRSLEPPQVLNRPAELCESRMQVISKTIVVASLLMLLAGCQPSESDVGAGVTAQSAPSQANGSAAEVNSDLQGTIRIDGSSTVQPISSAIAEQFHQQFPNVAVPVGINGTGNGFKLFATGEIDISDASRPIKPEEFDAAAQNNIAIMELPIAYDGLTLVVHKSNMWMDQLTMDEIKKIFLDGGAKSWSEVRGSWPNEPVVIYSPGTGSGTFDYFKDEVAGKTGSIRSDMTVSEDDNVLVTGVAGNKNAIGFFGLAYYEANKDKLRAVPVVNPKSGEAVFPMPDKIKSGEYAPFSRPLFIYVNMSSFKRPEVKAFVKFYLDKAPETVAKVGYVELPVELYDRAKQHREERISGTHFLGADKKRKSGTLADVYQDLPSLGNE